MSILTQFPSRRWQITLNRVESSGELTLDTSHIIITGNSVTSISGSGLQRVIALTTAVSSLEASTVSILNHTGMEVVSTQNQEKLEALNQIRNLIWTNLTQESLPDSVISQDSYLGLAELEILNSLELTSATYDTKAAADSAFARRARIAVIYRTAAYLLPAVPQLLRESIQQENQQFAEVDWKERQTFFLTQSNESIKDDLPEKSTVLGKAGLSYTKYTAF